MSKEAAAKKLIDYERARQQMKMQEGESSSKLTEPKSLGFSTKLLLLAGAIFLVVNILMTQFVVHARVTSESMENTLPTGSFILGTRRGYEDASEVQRGDVVVFGVKNSTLYVKRVIGLPGDRISLQDGEIQVNDSLLVETYTVGESLPLNPNGSTSFEVPPDSFFLLGDNREHSLDSRGWTSPYISYDYIQGRVDYCYSLSRKDGIMLKDLNN